MQPLLRPSEADRIYAAGFFDGEGSIVITQPSRTTSRLTVHAAQSVAAPLLWLRDRWGGSIRWRPARGRRRASGQWQLASRAGLAFLIDVRPWLIVKADQADVAVLFASTRRHPGRLRWDLTDREANVLEGSTARLRLIELRKEAV
jgi:hypothetical protein